MPRLKVFERLAPCGFVPILNIFIFFSLFIKVRYKRKPQDRKDLKFYAFDLLTNSLRFHCGFSGFGQANHKELKLTITKQLMSLRFSL